MAQIDFDDATIAVHGSTILRNVTLSIADGEFVGVVGPSGSGKTTLIRTIAGFTDVVGGRLLFDGVNAARVKTAERDVGMVFQEPVLFGNRSVKRNVSFPLEIQRQEATEIAQRVNAEVRSLHIEHLLQRHPRQLSRGESQLVQIARAMVRSPQVLLLDEPLASLDAHLQGRMRAELQMLQEGYGVTTVMTTNDPADAMSMPARLVVIDAGRVVQVATPSEVRRRPPTLDAALSTGECGLLDATVVDAERGYWLQIEPRDGAAPIRQRAWTPALADRVGERVTMAVRPEAVRIVPNGPIASRVKRLVTSPARSAFCDVGTRQITVLVDASVQLGDAVQLQIDEFTVFDRTGRAIS